MNQDRSDALRELLDFTVYAPIGAMLHGPKAVADLANKGRQDVKNARLIGQMTLKQHNTSLDDACNKVRSGLSSVLAAASRVAAPKDGNNGDES
ncbi:MAG: hypothetical protein WC184_01410 [Acidimicrobiia bacterium]